MTGLIDINELRRLLADEPLPRATPVRMNRSASVLMPLFEKEGEVHLLAVLKTDTEGYPWRNQVALPGGHVDLADADSLAAAYREIEEELNIDRSALEIIGSLGHFQTIRETEIEAFAAYWTGDKTGMRFDPLEISQVLDIPITTLIRTHVAKDYSNRVPDVFELIYPFDGGPAVIWGVTARIIHFFLEHLRAKNPERFGAEHSVVQ